MHQHVQATSTRPSASAVCVVADDGRVAGVAAELAGALGAAFLDGDLLHRHGRQSARNHDPDHWHWLSQVGRALAAPGRQGVVIACTGLTFRCREVIRWEAPRAVFVRLAGANRDAEPDILDLAAGSARDPAALARSVLGWASARERTA